jgi:peptidoglycan DL-endopeptidase CwlO
VNCRTHRARGRLVGAAAAALLSVGVWASVAGATQFTTATAQAKVHATEAQVTQIEQTIAQEQQQSAVLGQEYDAATAKLQSIRAALAATDAQIARTRKTISRDKKVLAKAAVQDYVLGAQGTEITSLFATSANTVVVTQEYAQTAIGNLAQAQHALESAENELAATEQQQQSEAAAAQQQVAKVQTLQQQNAAATQQAEATLASVKGALATEVAQAAQAKAAKEAAAAAAAQQQAAREAAARQAAEAANVVNEFGGTTAAATASANQAASSAGAPTVGYGGGGSGAGSAAVAAAESQLGVPYVWGGESPGSGFDCSGLTQWSWGQAGVAIPRTSEQQYATVPHASLSDLQPGDLLFYYNLDGTGTVDHVAMYVGSGPYGSATIIQAPYTGATVSYDALYTDGLIAAGQP